MRAQPNRNYVSDDVIMTPRPLAEALARALSPSGRILEPSAGDGAFVETLRQYGTVETCEITDGSLGFTWWTEPVDWVITNPPWSQYAVFLRHAMTVATHVAFLSTVNHLWTKRRVRDVREAGFGYRQLLLCEWPVVWPSSGFQLGMMHLQRGYDGPMDVQWVK